MNVVDHVDHYRMLDVLWPDTPFRLLDHVILAGKRGSEAHGTYVPPTDATGIDDRDIHAIVVPPPRFYCGLQRREWEHAEAIKECWDVVVDEFIRYVRLLRNQNPGMLQLLWLRAEDYLYISPYAGQRLLDEKRAFRAKMPAFNAFVGYARGQFSKMGRIKFMGYMGEKRKVLVERFGYDTKNAAHMIRLLETGRDYLQTGEISVFRPEAERARLLAIKRGEWKMQQVMELAATLFDECEKALDGSPLPDVPDESRIAALVQDVMQRYFGLDSW